MHISLGGMKIPLYSAEALVIGSGAAGLNCADELLKRGVDVIVASQGRQAGTSLNAGSDKQTYHKLGLSGDSVRALAGDLFRGGHMHGDTALALAAGSLQAFFKLVELGVPFPHDRWGQYAGYQTDHDLAARATSAGPLTSRFMAQRLEEAVKGRGARFIGGILVRLLTRGDRVVGALFYDPEAEARDWPPLSAVCCTSAVLCTGGAADLYEHSVFPLSQQGALGTALLAGAKASNLWSWQYGIASTGVRWNLSGTYQQVLPHYVSGDSDEVLDGWCQGNPDDMVFLKGYQWPFDARKSGGSSLVDLGVIAAVAQGKQVALDFHTKDAYGRLDALGQEGKAYLANSGAAQRSPYERLLHMNPDAVELYRSKGVDLAREVLPVAVCAQHMNGGLSVDAWWRTSLEGLYAAGETAGCFGAYRPGGAALNETQVGSLRAAQHIASQRGSAPETLCEEALSQIEWEVAFLRDSVGNGDDAAAMHAHLRRQMSLCAGPVRRPTEMRALLSWAEERARARHSGPVSDVLRFRDALAAARASLSAMLLQASSLPCPAGHLVMEKELSAANLPAVPDDRFAGSVVETWLGQGSASSALRPVRPIPEEEDSWFENVWRAFRDGSIYG